MAAMILHLRHIPCKVLETDFRAIVQELGLDESRYEVFFPKRARRTRRFNNFGYGFVTCNGQEDAEAFARTMDGYRFEHIDSRKQLVVEWGNLNAASRSSESEAHGAMHAAVEASADSGLTSSFATRRSFSVALSPSESMSVARGSATYPALDIALQESSLTWVPRHPGAHEVPPTRLAFDEGSLAHVAVHSGDELANGSSQRFFRFQ
eukprot:TRINITY_DN6262_c0_g2_i3.p1 TRINITY_DN6262_c0_g2~~TRINITY_DN6262_c0_g2_i3.p1  ORF type:complete len:227 (+),score=33.56 TRINITY_DN6262_c0_g2_i3:58-681(+)